MTDHRLYSEALLELDEAAQWYEDRQPGLGRDFIMAVNEVFDRIKRNPMCGERYKRTQIRHCLVRRFPYVIYYRPATDFVWIIAVAHGSRKEGYWRRRRPPD